MVRYRLSNPAKKDIAKILNTSEEWHGAKARTRYRGLLTAAIRKIAADPCGVLTVDQSIVFKGLRSLHIKHCRFESRELPVKDPVHILFYRLAEPDLIEIIRILHERMDVSSNLGK